ncbi:MAG: hypothetical protein MJ209_04040 [archaeon]|nr:hypothetical protein [archaeon]
MDNVLRNILAKNPLFKPVKEDDYTFIPRYLGLIANGVAIFHVNWVYITEEELIFFSEQIKDHPIASVTLNNLDSLMIVTENGIKEVL